MVAEGAGIKDAVCASVILDGLVAQVDGGFRGPGCKFCGVFVEVVQVVLVGWSVYFCLVVEETMKNGKDLP